MATHSFLRRLADDDTNVRLPAPDHLWDDFLDSRLDRYAIQGFEVGHGGVRPVTDTMEIYQCAGCNDPGLIMAAPTEHTLAKFIERHEADAHDRDVTITDISHYANQRRNGD